MGDKNFFRKSNKCNSKCQPSTSSSEDFFFKPSSIKVDLHSVAVEKRPFDKNKWRSQKYSKKNKVESWKEKRKNYILHAYRKEQNREKGVKFDVQKIYEEEEKDEDATQENSGKTSRDRKKLSDKIREQKEEKERRREEFLKKKTEKEQQLKKVKKEKMERHKKLNRKTKRGQPIMKGRIEYLLERIQKTMTS